jgi:hypothetical protein
MGIQARSFLRVFLHNPTWFSLGSLPKEEREGKLGLQNQIALTTQLNEPHQKKDK